MMNALELINKHLETQPGQPPLDQWQPPLSGDIDIVIKANGDWIHEGGKIERHALVKLFFSILRREADQHYYLVTPVEKWRIRVEQTATVVVDMDVINAGTDQQQIIFTTAVDGKYLLGQQHPLTVINDAKTAQPFPFIQLPYNLTAKLSRAVFYRLAAIGEEKAKQLQIFSDTHWFTLGSLETSVK